MLRRECRCDDRRQAQAAGDFLYWPHHRVWVFAPHALPPRSMSSGARIGAFVERAKYPHEDHDGEPYSFVECPFCQMSLPGTDDPPRLSHPTGNGEGPEA